MMPVSILCRAQAFVECCVCDVNTSKDHYQIIMNDSDDHAPTIRYICDYCFKFIRGELK